MVTIRISEEVQKGIRGYGKMGESYDTVLLRILVDLNNYLALNRDLHDKINALNKKF